MATFFVLGNNLIDGEEYNEKLLTGQLTHLLAPSSKNKNMSVAFRHMELHSADIRVHAAALAETIPFQEIGIGKPLSVEILTIYTGDFIKGGFLSPKKRDILCTSGVKATETYNSVARSINLLQQKVEENFYMQWKAFTDGTPFVYYTKAMDTDSLLITVELDANSFDEDIFGTISNLLGKAAGIPLFLPAAPYLLGGSQLINIAGEGGNNLFELKPFISETITLRFATAGLPTNIARQVLLCREQDKSELGGLKISFKDDGGNFIVRLTGDDGKPYTGNAPYIVLNIDGAEKTSLESFTPTLASNSILKKFYGGDNTLQDAGNMLLQAMSLYNDFNYRTKADKAESLLQKMEVAGKKDTDEYKKTEALLEAYKKNIQNDLLQKQ